MWVSRRPVWRYYALLMAVAMATPAVAVPTIGPAIFNTTTAAVAERVEGRLAVARTFENPYDPRCVQLDAMIEGPLGQRVYPCFFSVPLADDGTALAPGEWVFRYAFRVEGRYTVSFRLVCADGVALTPPQEITVKGRRPRGFVQPDLLHPGFWIRDDGERFFASGLNVAWAPEGGRAFYQEWLERCAAADIRFMRVWMIGFARQALEWSETLWAPWNTGYGLGRYNQQVAAFFDWLFEEAARQGVAIQLVMETHGEWSTCVDPNWGFNPYNVAHGGFLHSPAAFFSDSEARRRTRARYRYCVARWGAESSLAAWELFNEADQTDAIKLYRDETAVAAWHQELARAIQTMDAIPRPVVSSATDPGFLKRLAVAAPTLDRLDCHFYCDDAVVAAEGLLREWRTASLAGVALACGEFGVSGESEQAPEDLARVQGLVRLLTWRGRLTGLPAWYWFWNKAEAAGVLDVNRAVCAIFDGWDGRAEYPVATVTEGGPPLPALIVTPELEWSTTLTNSHKIVFDGATNLVLQGQSAFLQGSWKAAKGRTLRLVANFNAGGVFDVVVSGASAMGANELVINVNGAEVWRKQSPSQKQQRLLVQVGEGRHVLELRNDGEDWLRIGSITLRQVAASLTEAPAITDGRRAVAYVTDKRFLRGGSVPEVLLTGVTLRLTAPPFLTDLPMVRFIDPADGHVVCQAEGNVGENALMEIALPPFVRDLVVVVE